MSRSLAAILSVAIILYMAHWLYSQDRRIPIRRIWRNDVHR